MTFALDLPAGRRSVHVVFGEPTTEHPGALAVRHGADWLAVLSVVDALGIERRDDLTAANLRELEAQMAPTPSAAAAAFVRAMPELARRKLLVRRRQARKFNKALARMVDSQRLALADLGRGDK